MNITEATCPACRSDDYSLLKRVQGGSLAQCAECNRVFEIPDSQDGPEVEK